MASTSVSSLVLFIAAITVAAGVAGTLSVTVMDISNTIDQRGASLSQNIGTDIEVISDSGSSAIYNDTNDTVTLLVKNTGEETLSNRTGQIQVMLDGEYVTSGDLNLTVVSADSWRPGEVARLVIQNVTLSGGDHRVKLVVNEEEEVFRFHV